MNEWMNEWMLLIFNYRESSNPIPNVIPKEIYLHHTLGGFWHKVEPILLTTIIMNYVHWWTIFHIVKPAYNNNPYQYEIWLITSDYFWIHAFLDTVLTIKIDLCKKPPILQCQRQHGFFLLPIMVHINGLNFISSNGYNNEIQLHVSIIINWKTYFSQPVVEGN